jgi:hypothetical protein
MLKHVHQKAHTRWSQWHHSWAPCRKWLQCPHSVGISTHRVPYAVKGCNGMNGRLWSPRWQLGEHILSVPHSMVQEQQACPIHGVRSQMVVNLQQCGRQWQGGTSGVACCFLIPALLVCTINHNSRLCTFYVCVVLLNPPPQKSHTNAIWMACEYKHQVRKHKQEWGGAK